jgi:hypothetical protein
MVSSQRLLGAFMEISSELASEWETTTEIYVPATLRQQAPSIARVSVVGQYMSRPWPPVLTTTQQEDIELQVELAVLRRRVEDLEVRIAELAEAMPEVKVIVLRKIPYSEAKDEVRGLFESGRVLDYGNIAEELSLDLQMVVQICQELIEEGMIGAD